MADFVKSHRRVKQLDNYSQNSVIHRDSSISGKDSPNGQITHEVISVVFENPLEIAPITEHSNPLFRDFVKVSDLVERPKKCVDRLSSSCRGTQSPVINRCVCQGLGSTFERPDSQWHVVGHKSQRSKWRWQRSSETPFVYGNG